MGSNPAIPTIDLGGGPRSSRPTVPVSGEQALVLDGFLVWLGYGLCHQLPERSFFGGGLQAPVCARDTGIYAGFVISLVVLSLLHNRERPTGFPRIHAWIVLGAFVVFMGWDGVTSYAGLRESTNQLRLASGLGVGFASAAVILPMLNDELWAIAGTGRVLEPHWKFASWLAAIPVSYAVLWWAAPEAGRVYPVFIAGAIVATLTAINLVIVAMLPAFDRHARSIRALLVPCATAFALSLLEIGVAGLIRHLLESIA